MIRFLEHIANHYEVSNSNSLKDKCFVFPSRRACIYFTDILQQKYTDKVFWSPTVVSIEEFIQQNCKELTVVDNIQLLFKLYQVHNKVSSPISFDLFYNWGLTLLKDFDEIDRYLVDAELLYKNLQGIEDIEAAFGQSEEVLAAIKGFLEVIDTSEPGGLSTKFQQTWAQIGKVFPEFKAVIRQNNWAYNGMCYRDLAENLKQGTATLTYDEVVFCGFNAISKSEEQIMDVLLHKGQATLFFDADKYYLNDEKQEAGAFLRKHKKKWRNHISVHWVVSDGFNQEKQINIIGLEQKSSLAKAAVQIINETQGSANKTAMLLADETLLAPVLYALPEEISDINISMGYPIAGTPMAGIIHSYLIYQAVISTTSGGKTYIRREALRDLINQPHLADYVFPELAEVGSGQSSYLPYEHLAAMVNRSHYADLLQLILDPTKSQIEGIENLISFFITTYYEQKDKEQEAVLENGVRYSILKYLQDLKIIIEGAKFKLDYLTIDRLIRESFKQMNTPFSGEPLASLQIMGFLESRALDFENIVLLSVNEDLLPASSSANTYIPFGIRKAFKLPTFLEHNSIYAYHFYRILQRAKNISLLYSTKLSVTGAGEQSRFILQLLHEFSESSSPVKISRKYMKPFVPAIEADNTISIEKTGTVHKALKAHFESLRTDRALAPTSLTDYINCSLKYYFSRILGIKEPEDNSDKIDARVFGNLLHEVIEKVYSPFVGKKIDADEIINLTKQSLPAIIDQTFAAYDKNAGEILFTRHIVQQLVTKILKNDAKDAPIHIIDLESKNFKPESSLKVNAGLTIKIGGFVDRLDQIEVGGEKLYRVLDYKTGSVDLKGTFNYKKAVPDGDYIKAHFTDPKYKSGFQILYYLLILKRMNPDWAVNGGIVGIKNMLNGVTYLRKNETAISEELIDLFELELKTLVNEILDETFPFQQTDDLKRCTYCQFKKICNRQ